jgi:hypothetical protein
MAEIKRTITTILSKSRYVRGLQCHKSLWLATYGESGLRHVSAEAEASFQQGNVVGELAQDIFPGGVLVPFNGLSFEEQLATTEKTMKDSKVIYEGTFNHDGILVKVDIMRKVRGGWELYEVKSSTSAKDVYYDDVAVQYYVLTGAGVNITKAFVVHLDSGYVRSGKLDLNALFKINDVTAEVRELQPDVKKEIARQKRLLKSGEPDIDIGPWCTDPYDCDFMGHCWKHIPDNSVFDLAGRGADKFALYNQGIVRLRDVPLEKLKGKQLQQVEALLKKKTIVDKKAIKCFLSEIWYPLYFFDFETFQSGIPPYNGLRPYQQIPFQFSVH